MKRNKTNQEILKILLKNSKINQTITSLADKTKLSRVGIWKVIKSLEKEKLIILSPVGSGKTSTQIIRLNLENPLTEKNLILSLTEDALKQQRWISNFSELENKADFIIIYGSILYSTKEAEDIDILIISNKRDFEKIDKIILTIQKTQIKKIHAILFTQNEFKQELKKPNKTFIDAIKGGVILFGQDEFIKFIKYL